MRLSILPSVLLTLATVTNTVSAFKRLEGTNDDDSSNFLPGRYIIEVDASPAHLAKRQESADAVSTCPLSSRLRVRLAERILGRVLSLLDARPFDSSSTMYSKRSLGSRRARRTRTDLICFRELASKCLLR